MKCLLLQCTIISASKRIIQYFLIAVISSNQCLLLYLAVLCGHYVLLYCAVSMSCRITQLLGLAVLCSHYVLLYCAVTYKGVACWYGTGLMIEMLRVRIPERAAGEFSSSESTLCADSYSVVRFTSVLPQWHVIDPGHSDKSSGGRLHLNTHIPLTQRSRSGLTIPLSRHSAGAYQEMSSHATRQGTLSHSRFSSLSQCGLILA